MRGVPETGSHSCYRPTANLGLYLQQGNERALSSASNRKNWTSHLKNHPTAANQGNYLGGTMTPPPDPPFSTPCCSSGSQPLHDTCGA